MIDCAAVVGFDWDAGNARKNEKHGVTQAEAEEVFLHRPLVVAPDTLRTALPASRDCTRWPSPGTDEGCISRSRCAETEH